MSCCCCCCVWGTTSTATTTTTTTSGRQEFCTLFRSLRAARMNDEVQVSGAWMIAVTNGRTNESTNAMWWMRVNEWIFKWRQLSLTVRQICAAIQCECGHLLAEMRQPKTNITHTHRITAALQPSWIMGALITCKFVRRPTGNGGAAQFQDE